MLRLFVLIALSSLLLATDAAVAGRPTPYRLAGLIKASPLILHARIAMAASSGSALGTCPSQGIYYEAEIIQILKGAGVQEVSFCTNLRLLAAGEYLLFFNNYDETILTLDLLVTKSHLNTKLDWLEVDTLNKISTPGIEVKIEQFKDCRKKPCKITRAREVVRFDMVADEIRRAAEEER